LASVSFTSTFEHLGDTLEVAQGEATLLLNWEQGRMSSAARAQRIGIIVPFDNADLSRSEIDRLAARRWPNTAALKLLRSYVSALATVPEREEAIEAATERHLVELVGLAARAALREDIAQHQEWWSKRLQTARETMARRFMDSKLDAATVAGEQGISTRYLQKLFERSGTRFVQELNDVRLRAAFEKLNNRHYGESTIMDIAMSSGFGDISHFNRLFRARYGESPTKIRRSR
jgi:AraC-like DNA-binding protein